MSSTVGAPRWPEPSAKKRSSPIRGARLFAGAVALLRVGRASVCGVWIGLRLRSACCAREGPMPFPANVPRPRCGLLLYFASKGMGALTRATGRAGRDSGRFVLAPHTGEEPKKMGGCLALKPGNRPSHRGGSRARPRDASGCGRRRIADCHGMHRFSVVPAVGRLHAYVRVYEVAGQRPALPVIFRSRSVARRWRNPACRGRPGGSSNTGCGPARRAGWRRRRSSPLPPPGPCP